MKARKFRWSKVYESSEEELVDFLRARQLVAERWAAEASQAIAPRQLEHGLTIWCAEGSLVVRADDGAISLQPGDALAVPAGAAYDINVGMSGCVCYETATAPDRG